MCGFRPCPATLLSPAPQSCEYANTDLAHSSSRRPRVLCGAKQEGGSRIAQRQAPIVRDASHQPISRAACSKLGFRLPRRSEPHPSLFFPGRASLSNLPASSAVVLRWPTYILHYHHYPGSETAEVGLPASTEMPVHTASTIDGRSTGFRVAVSTPDSPLDQ
jgi:hypothetical protein